MQKFGGAKVSQWKKKLVAHLIPKDNYFWLKCCEDRYKKYLKSTHFPYYNLYVKTTFLNRGENKFIKETGKTLNKFAETVWDYCKPNYAFWR